MTYSLGMMRNGRARRTLVGMRVFVLLVALFTIGCAQGSQTVVLDWRGSEEGYPMALAAADEWASVCGAAIVVGKDNGGAPAWDVDGWVFGEGHAGNTRYGIDGKVSQVVVSHYEGEVDVIRHELTRHRQPRPDWPHGREA